MIPTLEWLQRRENALELEVFVALGGGLGFKTGCALQFDNIAHNWLWLSIAHAFGHRIETFGNKEHSHGGPLALT